MKQTAPLEAAAKKPTMRSRMMRASRRFEQPPKVVSSAFDQFLSKAFDTTHLTADLAELGTGLDNSSEAELRMSSSQLESSIWDALGGGGSTLEASVCAPDHMLRRSLIKEDKEDVNAKLNDALASLGRCSFLYETHAAVADVTKPLHLKKDAGPRTLGELAHLRGVVHNVSSALASGHTSRPGITSTAAVAKRTVRRKPVPAYDAADLADDVSGASSRSSSLFDGADSVRSSMHSQRTSLDSSPTHASRPALKHHAASLPTHLSHVPSLATTPLRVMEVDQPLDSDADEVDQGIKDEMLTAITYANLPRSHPLRRDSIIIPQPVVRPPRRPVPAVFIAEEEKPKPEPVSLAAVGRTTSAPQLPCIEEMGDSPTLPERAKPAPLVLAPTLPPIAMDEELDSMVISPLSAAVTAAANVSMVDLQRGAVAAAKVSPTSVSAPCTPRDPRAAARRENAESVLWRPDTARGPGGSTTRSKRASPPPRLPRSRKRPTTVDMGVPLKGLGPTSIDVEALQALLRDAEVTQPDEEAVETTVEDGEHVQVLPCFAAAEGWTLMGHVHQVGEVTPRASKAPIETIEYLDMPTPRNADFALTPLPVFARAQEERKPSFAARQRSDSMSSAASSSDDSGFSSDVPSLASDTSGGGGYESDSSATSFSTATSSGDECSVSSASSGAGKGKAASQYKPGSRPPMRSILPYITSSIPADTSPRSRSGSLPCLPRDSLDMQPTTVLHRRQLSEDGTSQRTTVLWELRLPLKHCADAETKRKTRHVRERHAALAGQEFESPLYHHWDQSVRED